MHRRYLFTPSLDRDVLVIPEKTDSSFRLYPNGASMQFLHSKVLVYASLGYEETMQIKSHIIMKKHIEIINVYIHDWPLQKF
jgi:hypothetical protein